MVEHSDLYGAVNFYMDELRIEVEKALSIRFELHDSMYKGGDYYRAGSPGDNESIVIQRNKFELFDEEETAEPLYASYPVIMQIAWTRRGDEYHQRLAEINGLDFLRRNSR
jgi:hypothetical protein